MVVESHSGGWSKNARRVLDHIAKHIASAWNMEEEVASLRIAQRLSVTLQRENARAVLRRLEEELADDAMQGGGFQASGVDLWQ